MADRSKIEWTDATWNMITGCDPISLACEKCYARRGARRFAGRFGYPKAPNHFDVTFHPDKLDLPLRWKKPRKVFACSMGDLFHDQVFEMKSPFDFWTAARPGGFSYRLGSYITYTDYPMLDAIFAVMERCPQHTFMLLTKRPWNMERYFAGVKRHKTVHANQFKYCPTEAMQNSPAAMEALRSARRPIPKNIWAGVTVEHHSCRWRVGELLKIPAVVKFVSVEPMLSPVYLGNTRLEALDWVICGAQTGPGAQSMKLEWARALRDRCQDFGIPFFFKSAGDNKPIPNDLMIREYPKTA